MIPIWLITRKIAHRGLHNTTFPENSLGAFENACKNEFPLELDVHLLADGNVAVFHDTTLLRMCGINKRLYDIPSHKLKEYNLLDTQYYIPTLEETLTLINGRVPIIIEIKAFNKVAKSCKRIVEILKNYKGEYAIKSFNPLVVIWFRLHASNIPRGMLCSSLQDEQLNRLYKTLIKRLSLYRLCKPDFISCNVDDLPNKYVRNKKVPKLSWTIRSPEQETFALTIVDNVVFENYIPSSKTINKNQTPSQSHIGV